VLGQVPAPSAVLIRPDGHVAWVAAVDGAMNSAMNSAVDGAGLAEALFRWFGAPATS
jgi:3-(3-hydroxy-phenyl)propionate hydroxylase